MRVFKPEILRQIIQIKRKQKGTLYSITVYVLIYIMYTHLFEKNKKNAYKNERAEYKINWIFVFFVFLNLNYIIYSTIFTR